MNKKHGFQPESSIKVIILKPSNKKSIKIFKVFPLFRNSFFHWGSLSYDDGEGYKKVTDKVKPDFIALIPSRSIRQMLAIFSGVEF